MATDEELIKILKGEVSEEELIEYFKKAGLNYKKMRKEAEQADLIHKKKGVYDEPKTLPKSYRNTGIPLR